MAQIDVKIPGFELLEKIGMGAESAIYKARNTATDGVVAIKHIVVDNREAYKYIRHVENEYENLTALYKSAMGPPEGIIRVYDLIRSGRFRRRKERVLVMDYIAGVDLRRERRYPMGQMIHILMHVADSLAGLHARGYLHADLKPENIIVEPSGKPTIIDFGFSRRIGSEAESIRGTREYIAPEQLDMAVLTERTDIYNFGATMYFLLSGRHLPAMLAHPKDNKLFIGSREMPVTRLREYDERIPGELDDLVMRCVRKEPIERPSCVDEVRDALDDICSRHFG